MSGVGTLGVLRADLGFDEDLLRVRQVVVKVR